MKFIIGTNKQLDALKAAEIIDKELSENNKNYQVARSKALKGVLVEAVRLNIFINGTKHLKNQVGRTKF